MQDTHRMEFYRIRELSRVREGAFHVMEPDESCKRIGERMRWCWCPDWSLTVRGTGTGMAAVIMTAILQGFEAVPHGGSV